MIALYALAVAALIVMGAALGIFAIILLGTRREKRAHTHTLVGPGMAANGWRGFPGMAETPPVPHPRGAYSAASSGSIDLFMGEREEQRTPVSS
jgi:hypothetical protein